MGIKRIEAIGLWLPGRRETRPVSYGVPTLGPDIAGKLQTGGYLDLFYNLEHDSSSFLGRSRA
jgi:hypothetical protein